MSIAYIGIGSNLDNPFKQIQQAIASIRAIPDSRVLRVSKMYRSQPVPANQPDFLNAALQLETALSPPALLAALQHIEKMQKRVKTENWGPRTIDLDILLFDQLNLCSPELTIPHPFLLVREFVIYPLSDIAPDLMLHTGENVASLRATLDPRGITALKISMYPGTFDPITHGHIDVIQRASRLFDHVIVAIGTSQRKTPCISLIDRITLTETIFKDHPTVHVIPLTGLLVDCATQHHAGWIIRGLRNATDFDYEDQLASINKHLQPTLETIFLPSPPELRAVSSTLIREIIDLGGDASAFVPAPIIDYLNHRE